MMSHLQTIPQTDGFSGGPACSQSGDGIICKTYQLLHMEGLPLLARSRSVSPYRQSNEDLVRHPVHELGWLSS